MLREIGTEIKLGKTISPFNSIGSSSAIDRTAPVFLNASQNVQKKKKKLIDTEYDADIAKYIPGTLEPVYQGMLGHIDTKEQAAHILHKDMGNLEFQILLTNSYYTNLNSIRICFLMKIKKATGKTDNIDTDLITKHFFFTFNKTNKCDKVRKQ